MLDVNKLLPSRFSFINFMLHGSNMRLRKDSKIKTYYNCVCTSAPLPKGSKWVSVEKIGAIIYRFATTIACSYCKSLKQFKKKKQAKLDGQVNYLKTFNIME